MREYQYKTNTRIFKFSLCPENTALYIYINIIPSSNQNQSQNLQSLHLQSMSMLLWFVPSSLLDYRRTKL